MQAVFYMTQELNFYVIYMTFMF